MAAAVTFGHLGAAAAALGQQVDDLALQQGGVGVHHDQVLGPAVQPGHLDREVDLAAGRLLGQRAPQAVEVGAGHGQLVAVHRVGGQADDPLDVAPARARCVPPRPPARRRRSRAPARSRGAARRPRPPPPRRAARPSTSTPAPPSRCASAARTPSTSSGAQGRLHAQQQAAVHAHLLHVLHLDAPPASAAKSRSAMPGPSWPLTDTRCGDRRAPAVALTAARRPSRRPSPTPRPSGARCAPARRPPRSGRGPSPRTTAPAATTTCSPIWAPGRITALAPSQLPDPMRTAASVGHCRPIGCDGVLVGVVLVGDVDVGAGLDVVTDDDLPVADDVRPPPDEAAAADGHDRVGRHLLAGRHPAVIDAPGPDDRLGADVDEVLVVDGALGEQQARPRPHPPEAPAPGVAGPDRPEVGGAVPCRVHQPGQRRAAVVRGGSGPSSPPEW